MRVAITEGTIIDGTGAAPVPQGVVLVDDGRITAVGPRARVAIPEGTRVVRVPGCHVIPGLIDAHNHLGMPFSQSGMGETRMPSDTAMTLRALHHARVHLESGVTTVRQCGEPHFIDIEWRDAFARGHLDGPRLVVAGPGITASNGHGREISVLVDGADAVRRAVRENLRAGVDWIKIFTTGSRATPGTLPGAAYYTLEEIRAAVDEAHRMGKRVGTHCHGGIGMTWAVQAGVDVIEHGASMSDENIASLVRAEIPVVVTMGVYFAESPAPDALDPVPPHNQPAFDSIARAHRAGVKLAAGGDTRHAPHTLLFELQILMKCGLTTHEALMAATRNGAEVCGLGDVLGTLQTGKIADVVVVGSNPLEDIQSLKDVRLVMKAGQIYVNRLEEQA
ncbi:MAG: amidohydrolase family protein [Armatimonadetes bacterium]|nr:amidohydrolase family protein [Armatimonadota bacterium]